MKYLIQNWLPKQSRLYSEPQQVEVGGEGALQNALATAKKNDYAVACLIRPVQKWRRFAAHLKRQ